MMKFLRKNFLFCLILLAGVFFGIFSAFSYHNQITHPALTEQAVFLYNKTATEKISAKEMAWMRQGSIDEDAAPRWINHFYDPINKEGLKDGVTGNPAKTAIEWARSSTGQTAPVIGKGDYTWEAAIYYYQQGDKEKAYIALGHILHLLEDMAVPAHVRDDAHPDGDPYENWAENYAAANQLRFENVNIPACASLEKYFYDLSYYTNTNFFSVDTVNSKKYSLPKIIRSETENGIMFGYNSNNNRVVKIIPQPAKWAEVLPPAYTIDLPEIHQSYFSNLAPKAVSYSAGLIKLFHEEVEKKQEAKPVTWWGSKIDVVKNGLAYAGDIFKRSKTAVKNDFRIKNQELRIKNEDGNLSVSKNKNINVLNLTENVKNIIESGKTAVKEQVGKVLGEDISKKQENNKTTKQDIEGGEIKKLEIGNLEIKDGEGKEEIEGEEDGEGETVKVKYVIDGDTIELEDGRRVRHIGIDAPELNREGSSDDECLAWVARERNRILLERAKEIILVKDNGADVDKYGRLLRYIYLDGRLLNEILAREGLGKIFICEKYMQNCPLMEDLERIGEIKAAGSEAENARRGIYSGVCEEEKFANKGLTPPLPPSRGDNADKSPSLSPKGEIAKNGGQVSAILVTGTAPVIEPNEDKEKEGQEDAEGEEGEEPTETEPEPEPEPEHEDTQAPVSRMEDLPDNVRNNFEIRWDGTDEGENASGILYFDVLYCASSTQDGACPVSTTGEELGIEWLELEMATTATSAIFDIAEFDDGTELCFRVRAVDNAGNAEEWPQLPHPSTSSGQALTSPCQGEESSSEQIKCTKINLTYPSAPNLEYPEDGKVFNSEYITASGTAALADIGKTVRIAIEPQQTGHLSAELEDAPSLQQGGEASVDENGNWKIENVAIQTGSSTISAYVVEEDGDESERVSVNIEKVDNDAYLNAVINEIAWMGTSASQDEWLELYNNTGFILDLAGWNVKATDGNPNIVLTGSIAPYGYYLLERGYDDATVDITADETYSGASNTALNNEGERLELRDSENNLIDYINCSLDWHAGDNDSKSTMERINPLEDGGENNWATNNGAIKNGIDVNGNMIKGTPKAKNSATDANGLNPHSLKYIGGTVLDDIRLTKMESPYCVDMLVFMGKLEIEKGTILKFTKNSILMAYSLDAFILAEGSEKLPIVFTSVYDDRYGGDSNEDGVSLPDEEDYWNGVFLTPGHIDFDEEPIMGKLSKFEYVIFEYGSLLISQSKASVKNSRFSRKKFGNINGAILISEGNLILSDSLIDGDEENEENYNGIIIEEGYFDEITPSIDILNNSFKNLNYGIKNDSDVIINARGNWWGDPSGPCNWNSNPLGAGVYVSDNVDYSEWLMEEP